MKRSIQLLVVLYACFATLGCMTAQPLSAEGTQLSQTLKPNDRVEVATTSGQRLKFKVETIDANGLQGAGHNVAFEDIESISLRKVSVGRTALVAVGVAAVAAVAGGGGGGSGGY